MCVLPRPAMKARKSPRNARAAVCAAIAFCTAPGPAFASDAASDEVSGEASDEPSSKPRDEAAEQARVDARWIPSASLFTTGHVQQRMARMDSDTSPDIDGDSLAFLWSFGGTADIASPVVLDLAGRPRLFAHADVGFNYGVEDPVVTEGDPGTPPVLVLGSNALGGILHRGSSVRAEGKPLVLSGGVGTVFAFEAFERGFRVRPTLEWMYSRDTIKNTLGGGEVEVAGGGPTACNPCRTLFIKTQTEKGFHSVGPGIELEADVGRAGEFLVGFYGSFRAYYLVGDRKANMRSTGSWTRTDNGQPSTVRADTTFVTRYEREPWHYRFGAGIRVLWSPEE